MRADATCYRHPDRRASVSCQRCNRPICTECMIQAPIGFHCPEDAKRGRQKVYTSQQLFRARPANQIVTMVLIAVNVVVFVVGLALGDDPAAPQFSELRVEGGLNGIAVDAGEWYRIFTSGFLHADLFHLAFNMYLLYRMGLVLERELGKLPYATVYAFALVTGSFGVLLVDPRALTVGASGAVLGLVACTAAIMRSRGINPFDTWLGMTIVLNVLFTISRPEISIGGHLGGAVGGFIAGWLIAELPQRSRAMPSYVPLLAIGALGLAVFGASFWAASTWVDPLF